MTDRNEEYLRRINEYFSRPRITTNSPELLSANREHEQQASPAAPIGAQSQPPPRIIPNNQIENDSDYADDFDGDESPSDNNTVGNHEIDVIPLLRNEVILRNRSYFERANQRAVSSQRPTQHFIAPTELPPVVPSAPPVPTPIPARNTPNGAPTVASTIPPNHSTRTAPNVPVQQTPAARPMSHAAYSGHQGSRPASALRRTPPVPPTNRSMAPNQNVQSAFSASRFGPWRPAYQQPRNSTINPPPPPPPPPPRRPSPATLARESMERRDREGRERELRNFLIPVDASSVIPLKSVLMNVDYFEERQRQRRLTPALSQQRPISSLLTDTPVQDQSTWIEDDAIESSSMGDDLLLNVNEPILASSGEAFEPRNSLPQSQHIMTHQRSSDTASNATHSFQGQGGEQQSNVPAIQQQTRQPQSFQQVQQVRNAPRQQPQPAPSSRPPPTQRPLSHNLAPAKPVPPMQPISRPQQARPSMRHISSERGSEERVVVQDFPVQSTNIPSTRWPNRPRDPLPAPSHQKPMNGLNNNIPLRPAPPAQRPTSSISAQERRNALFEDRKNPTPQSRNSSIPERPVVKVASITRDTSMSQQPQIMRTIQNLPEIGMHDITDVWGLQNETTALFESTQENVQRPASILMRRPNDIPAEQLARNEQELRPLINVMNLTPESLDGMDAAQLVNVLDALYYGSPRQKYKSTYPYIAEGVVQKDSQLANQLKVFSSRLGKVYIPDSVERGNKDYVYFIVASEGDFRGFVFDSHPSSLVSAKFPAENRITIRGYAILGHAPYKKSGSRAEGNWICWNDSMGMMRIVPGAARTSLKKLGPAWDKELDIVTISSSFENNRFIVTTLVALTNVEEKKKQFPTEAFLVQDLAHTKTMGDDLVFYSPSLDLTVLMKNTLVDDFEADPNRCYEIVAVPTFPRSTTLEFRGILLINNEKIWKNREWIREKLLQKTETYRADYMAQRLHETTSSGGSRQASNQLPPRSK